jgi:omega-amidase
VASVNNLLVEWKNYLPKEGKFITMQTVTVTFFQYNVSLGNIEENLKKVEKIAPLLPEGGLFVLPEMFCCGFDYPNMENLAKQYPRILEFVKAISQNKKNVIVGTAPKEVKGKLFNTAFVVDNGNLIAERGKIELFPIYREGEVFTSAPEEENRVIETSVGKLGILICFEVRFNKYSNKLRREGVEVLIVPAMWGIERREHFKVLTRARAVENQSFLVAVNSYGKTGKTFFGGASGVYSPWGEVLTYSEDGESLNTIYIDLEEVKKVRKKLPIKF